MAFTYFNSDYTLIGQRTFIGLIDGVWWLPLNGELVSGEFWAIPQLVCI